MEQIVIQVQEKEKAKMLYDLLKALDFVKSVKTEKATTIKKKETSKKEDDFFSYAGLWDNRNISTESLRKKAWPER